MSKYYDISNLLDENKNIMKINEILNNINSKYEDYYVQDIVSGDDLKLLLDYIIKIREYYNANVAKYEDLIEKYSNILEENNKLQSKIYTAIKKLEYYNSGEALYYVPIQYIINILKAIKNE